MLTNLDLLRRVPMFSLLSDPQIQSLSRVMRKRQYKKGEMIVEQGGRSDRLFIILTGRARVVMTDGSAREVILAHLKAGDCIGEMSLIDNESHSASVYAEAAIDVLMMDRGDFSQTLKDSPTMSYAIMRGLVIRLRHADRKIGSLALMSVYGRVANVLLEAAQLSTQADMVIPYKISRQDISKMVGASREMVSRVMKDFEAQGFIEPLQGGALKVRERRTKAR